MSTLHYRPMTMADHSPLIALFERTPGISVKNADSFDSTERYLRRNPGLSFVVLDNDKIIGCCMSGHDGKRGYLQHLVVDTHYRGQGISRHLVDLCIAALAEQDILKTHLFVLKNNPEGRAFWEHLGWQCRAEEVAMYSWIEGDDPLT
ncbi:GNAT family N-acetyltransferase [Pokkaliibacter sp. CJK22405]|uniref:GNAT family N-acetyltransferase n=1 Tax=Pokkaliibacter sp. CJK22405 TaxID=3384615 RepID=UPI003984D61C